MPKVKVTIEEQGNRRTYASDYVFVASLDAIEGAVGAVTGKIVEGLDGSVIEFPSNYCGGMGMFTAAVAALAQVAETKGTPAFAVAARQALKVIRKVEKVAEGEDDAGGKQACKAGRKSARSRR